MLCGADVCTRVCACKPLWGQRPTLGSFLYHSPPYFTRQRILRGWSFTILARLTGQEASRIYLCLRGQHPIPCWDYSCVPSHEAFVWCWGLILRSSVCRESTLATKPSPGQDLFLKAGGELRDTRPWLV